MDNYDDILHLPHPVSKTFPQMSLRDRAAQFAPFAALNGHNDAINETARFTNEKIDVEETNAEILDRKMAILLANLQTTPKISITYFQPDEKKKGGLYKMTTGNLQKVDEAENALIFTNKEKIPLNSIFEIEGEIFKDLEE